MTLAEIRARARLHVTTRDPRYRRGMSAQDTQVFDLEVDRLKGRQWIKTGRASQQQGATR